MSRIMMSKNRMRHDDSEGSGIALFSSRACVSAVASASDFASEFASTSAFASAGASVSVGASVSASFFAWIAYGSLFCYRYPPMSPSRDEPKYDDYEISDETSD
jgi:hypothetical protein